MGVIRERLNEVLLSGSAGTTPTKEATKPRSNSAKTAGRILAEAACRVPRPMPEGERFARALREGQASFPIQEGAEFIKAIRG